MGRSVQVILACSYLVMSASILILALSDGSVGWWIGAAGFFAAAVVQAVGAVLARP